MLLFQKKRKKKLSYLIARTPCNEVSRSRCSLNTIVFRLVFCCALYVHVIPVNIYNIIKARIAKKHLQYMRYFFFNHSILDIMLAKHVKSNNSLIFIDL